ncbi:MAG: hypothetical protein M5U12_22770 [Verrucomicrobia bacterium]|nr:hypothetical protein [Verrucomicrobiota bacterium]
MPGKSLLEVQLTTSAFGPCAAVQARTAVGEPAVPAEAAEAALWQALGTARTAQSQREQLAQQLEQARRELETAQAAAAQASRALEERMRLAGLQATEDLEPLLARLEQRQTLRSRVETMRDTLVGLARGQTVDEFLARVRSEDAGTLGERKAAVLREQEEASANLAPVRESVFRLRTQKTALERAGDAAANFRQQTELCAAVLKRDGSRFLRLRLAIHLLQQQIERFRTENQGPLLEESGRIFRELTRGAFAALSTEYNRQDQPVLVAVRPNQERVFVEGLSDGTRDQLYLALRLAALGRYADGHEPMPLILDDLLITFDDERAQAVLAQLATLARRTQILLFTHHLHLVELCRRTLGSDQFRLHQLSPADLSTSPPSTSACDPKRPRRNPSRIPCRAQGSCLSHPAPHVLPRTPSFLTPLTPLMPWYPRPCLPLGRLRPLRCPRSPRSSATPFSPRSTPRADRPETQPCAAHLAGTRPPTRPSRKTFSPPAPSFPAAAAGEVCLSKENDPMHARHPQPTCRSPRGGGMMCEPLR